MTKKLTLALVVGAVLVAAIVVAVGSPGEPDIAFSVVADKAEYDLGEVPKLTFTFTNRSDKIVLLSAIANGNIAEIRVKKDGTRVPEDHRPTELEVDQYDPRHALVESLQALPPGAHLSFQAAGLFRSDDGEAEPLLAFLQHHTVDSDRLFDSLQAGESAGLLLEVLDLGQHYTWPGEKELRWSTGSELTRVLPLVGPGLFELQFTYSFRVPYDGEGVVLRGPITAPPVRFRVAPPAAPKDVQARLPSTNAPRSIVCSSGFDTRRSRCEQIVQEVCSCIDCTGPPGRRILIRPPLPDLPYSPMTLPFPCLRLLSETCSNRIVVWDPDLDYKLPFGDCAPAQKVLAHELQHANRDKLFDFSTVTGNTKRDGTGDTCEVRRTEANAVAFENKFAALCGRSLCCARDYYVDFSFNPFHSPTICYLPTSVVFDGIPEGPLGRITRPGCLPAGDVVYHLTGWVGETEWRRPNLREYFDCWIPKAPDAGGTICPSTLRWMATYPAAYSGGSFSQVEIEYDDGGVTVARDILMSWKRTTGGLDFSWPGVDSRMVFIAWVKGPEGTPCAVEVETTGGMDNTEQSPFQEWLATVGRVRWESPGFRLVTSRDTESFQRDTSTGWSHFPGPVVIDGADYSYCPVYGPAGHIRVESMWVSQNGSWGGNHTGRLEMTTVFKVTVPDSSIP